MEDLSIVNVVGGGSIGRELNLQHVYRDFPHSDIEYEPETFAAIVIRYDSPKGTVMLYRSGKYSLAGAQSPTEAQSVGEKFIRQLEQLFEEKFNQIEFEIRYLVGTADLGGKLDLNQLAVGLGVDHTEYEPEQFPGLFYRPINEDWFCTLFASGKFVIGGVRSREDLEQIADEIAEKLDCSVK